MNLELTEIRRDDSAQPRAMLNTDHIKDLADALEGGAELTPVDVFHDGFSYWLADGFHRYSAYHRAKRDEIPVNVHEGDLRAAVLYSITANTQHSVLKMTREEKRASVTRLLKDEEWGQWSDREIGRRAGVAHPTVGAIRKELGNDCKTLQSDSTVNGSQVAEGVTGNFTSEPSESLTAEFRSEETYPDQGAESVTGEFPSERTYTTKHGTTATMKTSNIGNKPNPEPSEPVPPRHLKTYSPPLTPDEPEEDDRLEMMMSDEDIDDEPLDLSVYPRPAPRSSTADIRVKPPDPSKQRPFMRAFLAAGAFNRLSDEVMVEALLSPENKTPQERALEQEFEIAMDKMRRCMAQAEIERKTVTA